MKQAVKSLIKSPAAFVIVLLIIVLVLLFAVRAATGNVKTSSAEPRTSPTAVAYRNLS